MEELELELEQVLKNYYLKLVETRLSELSFEQRNRVETLINNGVKTLIKINADLVRVRDAAELLIQEVIEKVIEDDLDGFNNQPSTTSTIMRMSILSSTRSHNKCRFWPFCL